jgi:hypothetical protein
VGRACGTRGSEEKCLHLFLWGKLKKRDNFETLDLQWKMILNRIVTDYCMWLRIGQVMGCCKHGNYLPQP